MPDRGTCMTPGIRASGPSYLKPVPPPPAARPPQSLANVDEPPMAIVRTVANRQEIVAVSSSALGFGVRPGLTLTEGRALCGQLAAFDHDPIKDARALEALARWMMRFTPRVALPAEMLAKDDPEISHLKFEISHVVYLDITGCERVFGGISNIVRAVIDALSRLRLSASVAVAPTPGAAWAFASFGHENGRIIPVENLRSELAAIPVTGLRLDENLRESLHHLGLETIGQVMNLPRRALPSRFGSTLLMRLDQALGTIDEPLVPLIWHASVEARVDFDGLVSSLEAIWLTFKRLIGQVVSDLTRRGCGARRVEVDFLRAYATTTITRTIALSRPSRDPVNLFNLIRCATENLEEVTGGDDDGFLGVRLRVSAFERIDDEQGALLDQERYAGEVELAQLIERLCVRLGEDVLVHPELIESHVPERAFAWHGFSTRAKPDEKTRVENPCHGRPLQLIEPTEIAVMVSPSDDRDGRPILFRLGREVHQLAHAIGPERISGEWWRGHDKTRDYFDVEDETGKRFWVFRVNETGKWYVHGMF